jgi:hypothetical protein
MYQDSAGTTPVTAVEQPVGLIQDKSGRGNHASQSTSASRPVLKQDGNGSYYLSFDGVDDFLQTSTITPGTDKVQVFVGLRKLSDAASGIFIEMSATVNSNAGTINLFAPSGAAANYTTASRGSAAAVVASYTNAAIAAPVTNQVTVLSDISGDSLILRANGSDVAQSTSDQGTGNFTAQQFYIGRRAGASTPYNGNLYSLITRFGSNLDAATIGNAETWVNGKTRAY